MLSDTYSRSGRSSQAVRELLTGSPQPPLRPPKASPLPLPPPLPVKPAGFSLQKGGVVPTPSKGIRKPPPAVPARCTPVVVASPTSDSSPEDVEEPTSEGSVKRTPPRVEPRRSNGNNVVPRSFQQNGVDKSPGSPRSTPPVPSRNGFQPGQGNGFNQNQNRQMFSTNQSNFSSGLSTEATKSPQSPGVFNSEKPSPKVSPGGFINGKNFQEENPEQSSTAETEELSVETPSSSTGTEEDSRKEVGERGVEADEEASDDEVENDVMSQK
ncbi:hypothetical protein J6590_037704 [Homalodisca vitripennis]|nr:hypothetical protein J6590_037704 [Homalodisca vitripennis]